MNKKLTEPFENKRDEAAKRYGTWADADGVNQTFVEEKGSFSKGADFGYLEGREAMAKEIVEWLRYEYDQFPFNSIVPEIEQWLLKKENNTNE